MQRAHFVKLFPAGQLGAGYIKAVRAPLSHVPMMAVGGVNDKNAGEFIKDNIVHNDEELEKLLDLDARGYEWLARDRDGKLFAFRNKPALSGAYWEAPRDPHPERIGGFDFVADDDDAPTEIRSLLGYPY